MFKFLGCILLLLLVADVNLLSKRVLPTNENCNPDREVCRKGDWIAENIADCKRKNFLRTCNARNDYYSSWTVDVAENDKCKPVSGLRFNCGKTGTNTRCVCSDYKVHFNECKCQYWPSEDPGVNTPAFCTGYYTGGTSGVHHWACCNNCNDPTPNTCDGDEWQGGSSENYCGECGQNLGGGRDKYYFNCGSCDEQRECKEYCSGPIRNLPGLCWRWLDCFQGCCLARALQPSRSKRAITDMLFCGDGICSEGESPDTCPSDCCYQVNEICSKNNTNICKSECCSTPTCCVGENTATSTTIGSGLVIAALVIISLIF